MIQVGLPVWIQITDPSGASDLNYAARVFGDSGPLTAWLPMTVFDGASYRVGHTYPSAGRYSVKKVVFSDPGLTTRDPNFPESDEPVQVVDLAALVLDVPSSSHQAPGSVGKVLADASGPALAPPELKATVEVQVDLEAALEILQTV